jgi:hypothetical protein
MSTSTLDRREFIAAAGAAAAVACVPVTLALGAPSVGGVATRASLADWHIDDMWGVYPRPHEAIGYGRRHEDVETVAFVQPADVQFLA